MNWDWEYSELRGIFRQKDRCGKVCFSWVTAISLMAETSEHHNNEVEKPFETKNLKISNSFLFNHEISYRMKLRNLRNKGKVGKRNDAMFYLC